MREIICVLFDDFETLDLFGPAEILGRMKDDFRLRYCSLFAGMVSSSQNARIVTEPFSGLNGGKHIIIVPGGAGVIKLLKEQRFISEFSSLVQNAEYILTVCTGSILLSKTGILENRKATSNKRLFSWALNEAPGVNWIKKARWVRDGNIYTSSGISAGIDMTLGFISDVIGYDAAKKQAREIEYLWNEDPGNDPFAEYYQ